MYTNYYAHSYGDNNITIVLYMITEVQTLGAYYGARAVSINAANQSDCRSETVYIVRVNSSAYARRITTNQTHYGAGSET